MSSSSRSPDDVPDMMLLNPLSPATILSNVSSRFRRHQIYTNVSSILVSVNPYEKLVPDAYSPDQCRQFDPYASVQTSLSPHIFGVVRSAYRQCLSIDSILPKLSQSILISGESGAGKTECTKHVLTYLAHVSATTKAQLRSASSPSGSPNGPSSSISIEQRLIAANPILEAWGNAKTLRNDNSSRFGKWISVELDNNGIITGGKIHKYLLEESRVVSQSIGERNYNILFQVATAAKSSSQFDSTGKSSSPQQLPPFAYLTSGQTATIQGVDDLKQFETVVQSFAALGIDANTRNTLFGILLAILWLGNVQFVVDKSAQESGEACDIAPGSNRAIDKVAQLLGIPANTLTTALTVKVTVTARQSMIRARRSVAQATETRDALAKSLYAATFNFVIKAINDKIRSHAKQQQQAEATTAAAEPVPASASNSVSASSSSSSQSKSLATNPFMRRNSQTASATTPTATEPRTSNATPSSSSHSLLSLNTSKTLSIGILDIFGFECFDKNQFEQLCINYANEKLQQHFVQNFFFLEQQLYVSEALDVTKLAFNDNSACVELLDKKPTGILWLIRDELAVPEGSDGALLQKLYSTHTTHANFSKPKVAGATVFTINHYAQPVVYSSDGLLDKNRNKLNEHVMTLFEESTVPLMTTLLSPDSDLDNLVTPGTRKATRGGPSISGGAGAMNVASQSQCAIFQQSLTQLLTSIASTQSHFVRCIKPNSEKKPTFFDEELVMRQLQTSGLIDAVGVSQAGYAHRMLHSQFVAKYDIATKPRNKVKEDDIAAIKRIIATSEEHEATKAKSKPSSSSSSKAASPHLNVNGKPGLSRVASASSKSASASSPQQSHYSVNVGLEYQIGKTRVFLRQDMYLRLESVRDHIRGGAATKIQARCRGFLTRRRTKAKLAAWSQVVDSLEEGDVARMDWTISAATKAQVSDVLLCQAKWHRDQIGRVSQAQVALRAAVDVSSPSAKPVTLEQRLAMIAPALALAKQAETEQSKPIKAKNGKQIRNTLTLKKSSLTGVSDHLKAAANQISSTIPEFLKQLKQALAQASRGKDGCTQVKTLILNTQAKMANFKLNDSDEVKKAIERVALLQRIDAQMQTHIQQRDTKALEADIAEANNVGMLWDSLNTARATLTAINIYTQCQTALKANTPISIKAALAAIDEVKDDAVANINLVMPDNASLQSLRRSLQESQAVSKKHDVAQAALARAMDSKNTDALFEAVELAEKALLEHQTLLAARGQPESSLSTILTTLQQQVLNAREQLVRSTAIERARQSLHDVANVHDDAVVVQTAVDAAEAVGLPHDEVSVWRRRLVEIRMRQKLNESIEERDMAKLSDAIDEAENLRVGVDVEVVTCRFEDVLLAAKHTLKVVSATQDVRDALTQFNGAFTDFMAADTQATRGASGSVSDYSAAIVSQKQDSLDECEHKLKKFIDSALIIGARESELSFAYEQLIHVHKIMLMNGKDRASAQSSHERSQKQAEDTFRTQKLQREELKKLQEEEQELMRRKHVEEAKANLEKAIEASRTQSHRTSLELLSTQPAKVASPSSASSSHKTKSQSKSNHKSKSKSKSPSPDEQSPPTESRSSQSHEKGKVTAKAAASPDIKIKLNDVTLHPKESNHKGHSPVKSQRGNSDSDYKGTVIVNEGESEDEAAPANSHSVYSPPTMSSYTPVRQNGHETQIKFKAIEGSAASAERVTIITIDPPQKTTTQKQQQQQPQAPPKPPQQNNNCCCAIQ